MRRVSACFSRRRCKQQHYGQRMRHWQERHPFPAPAASCGPGAVPRPGGGGGGGRGPAREISRASWPGRRPCSPSPGAGRWAGGLPPSPPRLRSRRPCSPLRFSALQHTFDAQGAPQGCLVLKPVQRRLSMCNIRDSYHAEQPPSAQQAGARAAERSGVPGGLLAREAPAVQLSRLPQDCRVDRGRKGGLLLHRQRGLARALLNGLPPRLLLLQQHPLVARHRKRVPCDGPAVPTGPLSQLRSGGCLQAQHAAKAAHAFGALGSASGLPSALLPTTLVRTCWRPHSFMHQSAGGITGEGTSTRAGGPAAQSAQNWFPTASRPQST